MTEVRSLNNNLRSQSHHSWPKLDWWILTSLAILSASWSRDFFLWEVNYNNPGSFFVYALTIELPLAVFIVLLWPITCFGVAVFKWRKKSYQAMVPLVISLVAACTFLFSSSGTSLWLKYNDWRYAQLRKDFFDTVAAGEGFPLGDYGGALTIQYPSTNKLSIGGQPAFYKNTPDGPLILYLTFTGIPDGMSGFLYAPKEINPKVIWPELGLQWSELWDGSRNIYFVGNG